ncbi:hypothetical protein BvCmsHHNP023_01019 [Escherichia coli]|nr:hypothetical protein BvCmsHHNP023_01019 [Escherichia coli]
MKDTITPLNYTKEAIKDLSLMVIGSFKPSGLFPPALQK